MQQEDELETTYYFISFSMPKAMLTDAIKTLGKNEVVVFRGPVKGETLRDFSRRLHELLGPPPKDKNQQKAIALQIDPTRFKKCGIQAVPATCIMTPKGPFSAQGILSGDYLRSRGQGNDRALGQTWEIAEMDLAEELRKRIMGVTKEDFKRETVKGVFLKRQYVKLPSAQRDEAFRFDPSVVRTSAMVVAGRVIAPKGQLYNPIPGGLKHSYVIFDATDSKQLAVADRLVSTLDAQNKSVRVIVTDIPSHKEGFDVMGALMKRFGRQVTILDGVLAKSLRLRALPSVVESTAGGMILINEVRP